MEIFVKVEFGPDILLCYHYYYKPKRKIPQDTSFSNHRPLPPYYCSLSAYSHPLGLLAPHSHTQNKNYLICHQPILSIP